MLVLYPALHEVGHLAAALLTGTRIVDAGFFPAAYVTAAPVAVSPLSVMLLTLSGIWFPMLFLLIPAFGSYRLYFAKLTVALISAVGALTSLAGSAGFGAADAYDDAALILRLFPELQGTVIAILLILTLIAAAYIIVSKPLSKTTSFFQKMLKPA